MENNPQDMLSHDRVNSKKLQIILLTMQKAQIANNIIFCWKPKYMEENDSGFVNCKMVTMNPMMFLNTLWLSK